MSPLFSCNRLHNTSEKKQNQKTNKEEERGGAKSDREKEAPNKIRLPA